MSYKTINTFNETTLINFMNSSNSLYIKDINIHLQRFSGFDNYKITDITKALKTGAVCNEYTIRSEAPHGNLLITNWINWKFGGDITKLVVYLKALNFKFHLGYYEDILRTENDEGYYISIGLSERKAINVYSPFNHSFIKPLTEIPAKWNMRHAIRAILNGQYDNLKCNGQYSDDYAGDAARNFGQGEIKDNIQFIKSIIESPSGWWTSIDGTSHVNVCCHSFDSNSFDLNILSQGGQTNL